MTEKTFKLPDVGEGLTEAEIVQWRVKEGDTVAVNDVIVEIETAKSLVELPSPFAGTVSGILVEEGTTVEVGTPIFQVSPAGAGGKTPAKASGKVKEAAAPEPAAADGPPSSSLTGTGPKADAVRRRPRRSRATAVPAAPEAPAEAPRPADAPRAAASRPDPRGAAVAAAGAAGAAVQDRFNQLIQRVLAKPPVRKAAKDLGINLADVPATGAGGEVTKQDLISYQAQRESEVDSADTFWSSSSKPQDSRIERVPVKGVRKATAKAMVDSAFSAPHVSIFVDVDASRTMEFVKRLKASRDFEGIKVSPLLILAKAVIWAAARNPSVNATWAGDEIHVKHFMNLGIAAATPRGLMVPNIKDAQDLSLKELAVALNELATTARA
ncbi:MAG: branched-chain alpha-keto acid dehydrogenase subunit, partial [Arthrobacter koreensis]